VVYLVAMEDGILPHERSLDHPDQLEEERRLVFVGITRGREEVHASAARLRDYRGTRRISAPSLFLAEMTGTETVVTGPEAPAFDGGRRGLDDEFSQVPTADDPAAGQNDGFRDRQRPATRRPDGLVLELDPAAAGGDDDGLGGQPPGRRRQRSLVVERAADLAAKLAGLQADVRRFETGQRVRHPEYGEGVISSISGTGPRSVGTVIFDGPAGSRKFILGHGALEPATPGQSPETG
jgi:DNA helicase-2/ATP-dependent DNA helicase PcrA